MLLLLLVPAHGVDVAVTRRVDIVIRSVDVSVIRGVDDVVTRGV